MKEKLLERIWVRDDHTWSTIMNETPPPGRAEYIALSTVERRVAEAVAATWKEAHDACIPKMKQEFMTLCYLKANAARAGVAKQGTSVCQGEET